VGVEEGEPVELPKLPPPPAAAVFVENKKRVAEGKFVRVGGIPDGDKVGEAVLEGVPPRLPVEVEEGERREVGDSFEL